jgi:hypothetical protein
MTIIKQLVAGAVRVAMRAAMGPGWFARGLERTESCLERRPRVRLERRSGRKSQTKAGGPSIPTIRINLDLVSSPGIPEKNPNAETRSDSRGQRTIIVLPEGDDLCCGVYAGEARDGYPTTATLTHDNRGETTWVRARHHGTVAGNPFR